MKLPSRFYGIVDPAAGHEPVELAQLLLQAGVRILQLRLKETSGRDFLDAASRIGRLCRERDTIFIVNDRADIARAAGADVLHLGQGDLPLNVAREIVGPATLIGLSTHDAAQAHRAARAADGAVDYFCVGPCWPTPTKPGRAAPGLQLVRAASQICAALGSQIGFDKPWFAIGGIDARRLPEVLDAGARRIVVVRAITAAADPRAAAEQLSSALAAAS